MLAVELSAQLALRNMAISNLTLFIRNYNIFYGYLILV
jgi:hypothetical protein